MATTPHSVGDILDCLDELADENEDVSAGQVMHAFGPRTFGPAIMVPALLEITPIGAIPGVPTFLASVIVLVAAQKMLGRRTLWLPGLIANRHVSAEKLAKSADKLRPLARFMDRHFHRRWQRVTHAPFSQIAAGIVCLLCLTVPFLEVLPFASSAPMLAIAGFGLAVLMRDGVLMVAALAASLFALGLGLDYWNGGVNDTDRKDGMVSEETVDAIKKRAKNARDAMRRAEKAAEEGAAEAGEGE